MFQVFGVFRVFRVFALSPVVIGAPSSLTLAAPNRDPSGMAASIISWPILAANVYSAVAVQRCVEESRVAQHGSDGADILPTRHRPDQSSCNVSRDATGMCPPTASRQPAAQCSTM